MKYYKNADSDDFVNIFSYTGGGVENNDKNKDEDNFVPLIVEEIEGKNKKMNIKVKRTGDIIESIDIECECGNKSRIVIDYDNK